MTSPRQARTREVLAEAVKLATGLPEAAPRPGQLSLVDDIAAAADPLGGHMAGVAPTGVGKSLAALSAAAVGAADYEERWLISTESISLQSQYLDKDAPVIVEATKAVTGKDVQVAVLKGWSNYACAQKAMSVAGELGADRFTSKVERVAAQIEGKRLPKTVNIDGNDLDTDALKPLLSWALRQHADGDLPGDRGSYRGVVDDRAWSAISVSTAECLGGMECPLASICKPIQARETAAEAQIVVTNHSMLAVQAANAVPVVIGNTNLGPFQGIIVDEAHTLPAQVRSQGQSSVSGRRVNALMRIARSVLDDREPRVQRWLNDGKAVAQAVESELAQQIRGARDTVKVTETQDPLNATGDMLLAWISTGSTMVTQAGRANSSNDAQIKLKRAAAAFQNTESDVDSVREHRIGTARWIDPPADGTDTLQWTVAQAAPVTVSGLLRSNLWTEQPKATEDDPEPEIRELTVAAISATLPAGFVRDAAINSQAKSYPSPFDAAYGSSMLFVPRAVDQDDVQALARPGRSYGKVAFDTKRHVEWAGGIMSQLVEANSGSALVLSATRSAGVRYAEILRRNARGRYTVLSQWDGESARVLIDRWRRDHSAVLVGTRSLMTGVDAPGETNTLVIVDRAPRAAGNPVDDARVEVLAEAFGGDKWAADRLVYVSDATQLLEQAAGRLIRSVNDSGMLAILDPRLLNAGPFKYNTAVRAAYAKAYERFTRKCSNLDTAVEFLKHRPRS